MQCNGVGGMHGVGSRIGSGARVPSCMKQRGPSKLLRKSINGPYGFEQTLDFFIEA